MMILLIPNYLKYTFSHSINVQPIHQCHYDSKKALINFGQKQISLIQSMEQYMRRHKGQFLDDQQIVNNGCCASFGGTSSSTSIYQTVNSLKSLRSSKERGIKLTRKHPAYSKSTSQTKIALVSPPQLITLTRNFSKRSSQILHPSSNLKLSSQQDKKNVFVKKCLEYKNKKIQEHKQQKSDHNPLTLEISTKQEACSTMRNTLRTFNSSQGLLLIQKPIVYSNSTSFQQKFQKRYKQQKSNIYSQRILLINKKAASKTLQRIFQETQGKKIITLESQNLNEDYQNQYSIAESYEFSQRRI